MSQFVPSKDPNDIDFVFFIWCDKDGTNTGSATDTGQLQGATISSHTVTGSGVTIVSTVQTAVTVHGVTYAANTVVTAKVSGGTANTKAIATCHVVLSDTRELDMSVIIPIAEN